MKYTGTQITSSMEKIENLHSLLRTFLDKNATNIECDIKPLQDCENYGSVVLELTVKYQNGAKPEVLNIFAKICPDSEFLKQIFPVQICFRNEINFYKHIIPCLDKFQKEWGLDILHFFCYCYSARNSLKCDNGPIDNDVVLLLENLKSKGYDLVDRRKGFDLKTTLFILQDLATFHAVTLGLKLIKPQSFQEHVINKLTKKGLFENLSKENENALIQVALRALDNDDKALTERVLKSLNFSFNTFKKVSMPLEPFATLIHNDLWINNILVRRENGEVMKMKMVDFQTVEYGSPAMDLLIFLFTSVNLEVLNSHCESFIKHYHDVFIGVLEKLQCNSSTFSFKEFQKEIRYGAAAKAFSMLILLVPFIHADKNAKERNENYTEADHFSQMKITNMCLVKLQTIIVHFAKNNWI